MSFSIQTNVNSLVAQENLRVNSSFQSMTIQRLTSGYRINSSGDDAAGLAVANKFRSDTAELAQGVRNANDGVSQLQIMDGGMNNIGKMLDRLKTLATQSSSATFTGDRTVLNKEYQTLVSEIDRQAQGIGLATGGHFAQTMGVYIGGGSTVGGTVDTSNGTVNLDLANSVVDSKALGLRTSQFAAQSSTGTNLAVASNTSIANIVSANGASGAATASFDLSGAGFSAMRVSVSLGTSDTTQTVADKLNAAIQALGNSGTPSAASLRNANIQVAKVTDSSGSEQLSFTSSSSSFQATTASNTANALMGHFDSTATNAATGASVSQTVNGSAISVATAAETVSLKVIVNGTAKTIGVTLAGTEADNAAMLATVTGGTGYAALSALGVTAKVDGSGKLAFVGNSNQSIQVQGSGDTANFLGLGAWSAESNTLTGSAAAVNNSGDTATVAFSINGGQKILVNFTAGSTIAATRTAFQAAIDANTELHAAGLTVTGATLVVASGDASVKFRMNVESQSGTLDLKFGVGASSTATLSAVDKATMASASGSSQTGLGTSNDVFSFAGLKNIGAAGGTLGANADQQVLSFSANDSNGKLQSQSVTLAQSNGATLDQAIQTINTALQGSSSATMKQIVAVKETNASGTAEGMRFISSLNNFSVNVGQSANNTASTPVGLYDGTAGASVTQGASFSSSSSGTMDISTAAGAQQAVVTLGQAVQKLGSAQAAIGKGQNQLNYAITLANSEISNFSSAQAQIRDADVASEAANLSKAQVLQQASIAAMAQANSAPQAVLALLRG